MSGLTLSHGTSKRQTTTTSHSPALPSVKILPHPRRSSISSNRNSERVSHPATSPLNADRSIKPPAINPHLTSWKIETRARLERVLSRGPSIRLLPSVIQPNRLESSASMNASGGRGRRDGDEDDDFVDDDDDEMSSVASEHAMLDGSTTARLSTSQPLYHRRRNSLSNPINLEHHMFFSKRQSGFMFDPDESDEKKQKCALQFAEGVKELQLRRAKNFSS